MQKLCLQLLQDRKMQKKVCQSILTGFRGVLQFVTGSSLLPPGGWAELSPQVQVSLAGRPGSLPTSHTCFNQAQRHSTRVFRAGKFIYRPKSDNRKNDVRNTASSFVIIFFPFFLVDFLHTCFNQAHLKHSFLPISELHYLRT